MVAVDENSWLLCSSSSIPWTALWERRCTKRQDFFIVDY